MRASFFILSKQKEHLLVKLKYRLNNLTEVLFMYQNYNMNQLVLPIDLEVKLQENDIAFAVFRKVFYGFGPHAE